MNKTEIHVIYGDNPIRMTYELLEKAQLAAELKPDMLIGLKPNLIIAKRASEGATTSPEIAEGVIKYLLDHGMKRIEILESSWVGDDTKRAFRVCGYEELSKKYGIPLHDLKDDGFEVKRVGELDIKVCKKALAVDFLINMPVLKAHCQTNLTCALKNLKGCIPDSEKRRFHSLGLHKPIGYLNKALRTDFIVVDAIAGDLTFEEGGNPVHMDRLIAGRDPVLIDAYAASLLGYETEDIEYIGIAARVGVGCDDLHKAKIIEHDANLKNGNQFKPTMKLQRLANKVIAKEACSACYGSLIHALQRLADKGNLDAVREPISIGQGFKGQPVDGIRIGQCTLKSGEGVTGCPPTAKDILDFLEGRTKS